MATYRKRGRKWRAELYVHGRRESGSFHTKAEAVSWATQREAELTGSAAPRKTLREGLHRYKREVSDGREGGRWEALRLSKFERDMPFVDKLMSAVSSEDVALWRDSRLREVKPGSVLREMGLLHSVFEMARREWRWVQANPMNDVGRPKRPKPRKRRITPDEIARIVLALGYTGGKPTVASQRIAVAFLLAIETGMRSGEIVRLRPHDLHLRDRWLHIPKSKNGDERDVPLSAEAVRLLRLMEPFTDPVFRLTDKVRDVLFREARDAAKIEGLTFHDTRHEAITRLARKLDVLDLARMIGHRDVRSLMIYYNATATEIAKRLD